MLPLETGPVTHENNMISKSKCGLQTSAAFHSTENYSLQVIFGEWQWIEFMKHLKIT